MEVLQEAGTVSFLSDVHEGGFLVQKMLLTSIKYLDRLLALFDLMQDTDNLLLEKLSTFPVLSPCVLVKSLTYPVD